VGADFIPGYLWIQKNRQPNWKAAREHLHRHYLSQPAETWPEHLLDSLNFDRGGVEPKTYDAEEVRQARFRLRQALKHVIQGWKNDHRECAVVEMDTLRVLLAGGMSWGDEASKMVTHLQILDEAGVTEAAGFYQASKPRRRQRRKKRT
jgi:hypothetical protein